MIGAAVATLGVLAGGAGAGGDVITFEGLAPGTAIDGVTLLGDATFSTQTQAFDSPTVEVEGVPEPSAYGQGAFLVGEVGDVVSIGFAIPVTRVSVDWTLDDTIHSNVQVQMVAFGADGGMVAFVQSFPEATGTWPSILGDNCAGTAVVEGVGEIAGVGVWFVGAVFADTFALDNIELASVACSGADVAAPFGVLDFSDVVGFLTHFGDGGALADLAAPFGQFDFSDVVEFLAQFGLGGCP